MQHCMIDLETMGNGPNSAIAAIGAVMFDPVSGLGDRFYALVDLETSVSDGGVMDASTVLWWLRQSDAARGALVAGDGMSILTALTRFGYWLRSVDDRDLKVWGNGADFDNVILAGAFRRSGFKLPWDFRNNRCFRTLRALSPDVPWERTGTAHNALDDAVSQAQHAVKLMRLRHGGDVA